MIHLNWLSRSSVGGLPSNGTEQVDAHVDRHHVGHAVPHAVDRPQHPLPNPGKDSAGTVVVVHPAGPGLLPAGSHDARPHDGDGQADALAGQQALGKCLQQSNLPRVIKSHLGVGVRVWPVPDHFTRHLRAVYDLRVHPLGGE